MNAEQKARALAQRIATHCGYASDAPYIMGGTDPHPIRIEDIARTLRRAQMTLRRWAKEMCNGTIQRYEAGTIHPEGKPYRQVESRHFSHMVTRIDIPDRERGALARVAKVCKDAGLHYYHQTDPRGCALYVGTEPLTDQNYSSKGIPCL